ncbi:MAG: molybdopterin-binding protein [Pelagimonas sp.]|jgi:molybdenum cofactor cytidylyltransferase|nr:molybdopterin-binding protein [Pelagimonas sp.]
MKFGSVPLAEAVGGILAHSVAHASGRLKKGVVLTQSDVDVLRQAGLQAVTVAQPDPSDITEDLAAQQLAQALVPDPQAVGLRLGAAATGRVNIYAATPGIVQLDAARIHALNAIDPMITVATVPIWQRLGVRGMVATVKIISYAVPQVALEQACLAGEGALAVRPPVFETAELIQTTVGQDGLVDKGQAVTRERLNRLGVGLLPQRVVPHDVASLRQAIENSPAEVVLILTGSATSDLRDVAPQAVIAAGGDITYFGMPVDPGNLLFFGTQAGRPVIGLPGCARAPAMNGADWVLERLLCGVEVGPQDIAAMGVGGLLKEIPQRGRLREA